MECYIYIQSIKISFLNSNMMKDGSVKTFFMSPEQFQKVEVPCYCTGPFNLSHCLPKFIYQYIDCRNCFIT